MQKVFDKPAELEKLAKERFSIPPFLMMENAARAMADFILSKNPESVLILCGKGNNGGDGYALGRLLFNKTKVTIISLEPVTASEAVTQFEIAKNLGITIESQLPPNITADVIVDCVYGIGFHGELSPEVKNIFDILNKTKAIKIACDIPSGLYFNADFTITMGEQKTVLYSDKAKEVCGQIIIADLGIPRTSFENPLPAKAFLIEEADAKVPFRTHASSHKGTYGHTIVLAGEKSGAGIISATAAMHFGSGLTSLYKTEKSNLEQFKISPELMITSSLPQKTSCIVAGPGFGTDSEELSKAASLIKNWFSNTKNPALVLDADFITWKELPAFLDELNKFENARIVLTPHLSELSRFVQNIDVKTLAESSEKKIELGAKLTQLYPQTTIVMKSANTFIASENEVYICTDGVQSLAKGGSGDVLAGMTGALLSQGYSAKDAAITAVEIHALAAKKAGATAYNMTPEKLINTLSDFS